MDDLLTISKSATRKVELKNDTVQSFDTKWDETSDCFETATLTWKSWRTCTSGSLTLADQLKQLLALYMQDTGQNAEPRSHSTGYLQQKMRETHSHFVAD